MCEQWLLDRCDGDLEDMPLHAGRVLTHKISLRVW